MWELWPAAADNAPLAHKRLWMRANAKRAFFSTP